MEKVKQIGTLPRTKLSNAAHMNMNAEIYHRLTALTIENSHISKLADTYNQCITDEQICVNRISKSANTELLIEADDARDMTLSFISGSITAYCFCPTLELRLAGKRLDAIMSAYRGTVRKPYSEETAAINGLLKDLDGAAPKADIKLLGLESFVALLNTQNNDYIELDSTRTDEYIARLNEETKVLRTGTDNAADAIIRRVNALQELEQTDNTAQFIDAVNQIYKKYSDLISAKGSNSKTPDKPIV